MSYEVDLYDGGLWVGTVDADEMPSVGGTVDGLKVVKIKSANDESQTVQVEIEYE